MNVDMFVFYLHPENGGKPVKSLPLRSVENFNILMLRYCCLKFDLDTGTLMSPK